MRSTTKSLNSTRPTEGHFGAYWGRICTRVILKNRKSPIFVLIFESVNCIVLTIWQVINLLEPVSDCNSFSDSVDNKNWQIWKTQLCCFQLPLYFVGLRISSGRFLKVRQKRPRTNKYLRKRMHNLKFIFDFHSRASHNTCIASRSGARKRSIARQKENIYFDSAKLRHQSCFFMFFHCFFFQVEMEYSASLWAFLSSTKEIKLPKPLPQLEPC